MKRVSLLLVCLALASCKGFDVSFGVGVEFDGKPYNVTVGVRPSGKQPRNVQPKQPIDVQP